jgi:hypothetical protein
MKMPWWVWAVLAGGGLAMALRASLHVATTASRSRHRTWHGDGSEGDGTARMRDVVSSDPSNNVFSQTTHTSVVSGVHRSVMPASVLPAAAATLPAIEPVSEPAAQSESFPMPDVNAQAAAAAKTTKRRAGTGSVQYRSSWHGSEADALATCGTLADTLASQRARYGNRKPVVWRCGCKVSGLGDRLKGIIAAWMLANILERPFLCEPFPSLAHHKHGVEPIGLDWREGFATYMASERSGALFKNRAEAAFLSTASTDYTRAIEIVQTTPAKVALVQA